MIPAALFRVLSREIDRVGAAEELSAAQAGALAQAIAHNGKDQKVRGAVRQLARRAYPEIHDQEEAAD